MLAAVTTEPTECACVAGAASADVCSSRKTVALLADFVEKSGAAPKAAPRQDPKAVVAKAAKELGCKSERCAVDHPRLADFAEKTQGTKAAKNLKSETRVRFKPPGPRARPALLSNYDIDGVLQRWAGEPQFASFYNCPFSMMDFEREEYSFGTLNMCEVKQGKAPQKLLPQGESEMHMSRRPCDTFACVLNTDSSTGPGKHWVCVFVDMRPADAPWTVEYFNSAGNSPPRAMTRWLAGTCDALIEERKKDRPAAPAADLARAVAVTSVTHQKSKTECGPYTLFYIRSRMEGNPYTMFTEQRTSDREMMEFRQHLFSSKE